MSKPKKPQKTKPLTWDQIKRWFDSEAEPKNWGKAHLDARFLTIPPSVQGVLHCLASARSLMTSAEERLVVTLANRAAGTYDEEYPLFRRDLDRAMVVCDWAVRCALPLWFDRLPTWCFDRPAGDRFRGLRRVLWVQQIIDALAALSPIWVALEYVARDRGTADERRTVHRTWRAAEDVMGGLAAALVPNLQLGHDDHSWICQMTARVMFGGIAVPADPAITATVPALVDVLCSIRVGDSRRSMADRCVWTASGNVENRRMAAGGAR